MSLNAAWLRDLRQRYDAFNYAWHRWVLNYQGQQTDLLKDLLGGSEQWRKILAWLLPMALVFGLLAWGLLRPRGSKPRDPLERALQQLQQRLAALDAARLPAESVAIWLQRIAAHWPQQRAAMLRLASLDDRQRYAADADPQQRAEMKALCRQLLRQLPRRRVK
jgi:hypothetical protein